MESTVIRVCLLFLTQAIQTWSVHGLTCLHCKNIPQPRHCLEITRCEADEVCATERSPLSHRYWLGCVKQNTCLPKDSTNNSALCSQCCSSDLCNSQGCGEPGFPVTRGPVCYDCKYHNDQNPCTAIDVCSTNEKCSILSKVQFGDNVLTSGCKWHYDCETVDPDIIIGNRFEQHQRSSSRILCNKCCSSDLCNLNCSIDHCSSSPCQNGSCSSDGFTYRCRCLAGWSGLHCEQTIDHCSSSPCQHGSCSSDDSTYTCHCPAGWSGVHCNQKIDHCASSPCFNGICVNELQGFNCDCHNGSFGILCDKTDYCRASPCVNGQCTHLDNGFHCDCSFPRFGRHCERIAFDCLDIKQNSLNRNLTDGIYQIQLKNTGQVIEIYCDMTTDGGGWVVFQKRFNGSVDFFRNFSGYEKGFGLMSGEFWLGLNYVYWMTEHVNSDLRLDLGNASGTTAYEVYQNFSLSSSPLYTLHIGNYSGTAGDSRFGLSYHNGYPFSTFDRDNSYHCATAEHGGWWYTNCANVNLNGDYATPGTVSSYLSGQGGVIYYAWTQYLSLKSTEMKFRRK